MELPPFVWLILILALASPVVYVLGRLELSRGSRRARPAAWAGVVALAAAWGALILAAIDLWAVAAAAAATPAARETLEIGAIALRFDGISLLLAAIVMTLTTLVLLYSWGSIGDEKGSDKHFALILLLSSVMIGLSCAGDLFNLWVWFEAMTIATYPLVAFYSQERNTLEATVKYLVQSAAGSVFILLGIALVLAVAGTLDLDAIQAALLAYPAGEAGAGLWLAAGVMFVIGFGVKVALVPLHTWLPDAHSQAPSGISALLSAVVIQAGLIALLRALSALGGAARQWALLLLVFGALNMAFGNLLALRQKQVKRLLAYSSISHIGYMILGLGVAIYTGVAAGAQGGFFHLMSHGLMKGLAFLAAGALLYAVQQSAVARPRAGHRPAAPSHHALVIDDLAGAATRYPWAALALSLAVLGLGGIPPLVGFMSKWQILLAGASAQEVFILALVIFAALNSVVSLAYYAPLVNAMYRRRPSAAVAGGRALPMSVALPLVMLALAVVILGLWPALAEPLTVPAAQALQAAFGW